MNGPDAEGAPAVGEIDGPDRSGVAERFMPGTTTVVVPAGFVANFEVTGAGGAGGHWGGRHGGSGYRLTGTLASHTTDRTFVLYCGEGGQVDADPALGGRGGSGYIAGGTGGWGANHAAGGGGGGGGASAIVATDGAVHIVAPGGGGGGGGAAAGGDGAVEGRPGDDGSPAGPVGYDVAGAVTRVTVGQPYAADDGGYGTSRRRTPGGGGGGGGGGWAGGTGGDGGAGGPGGRGGAGAFAGTGALGLIATPADDTDPDRGAGSAASDPGVGGRAGIEASSDDDSGSGGGVDPRIGHAGRDGYVRLVWSPPGHLAGRLAAERFDDPGRGPLRAGADRPVAADRVSDAAASGTDVHLEIATVPRKLALAGIAVDIWRVADGSVRVDDWSSGGSDPSGPSRAELLDGATQTIHDLRAAGFLTPYLPFPGDDEQSPFGFGYDLVGARYPLRADPTGRPTSADLLRHVHPDGSPARATLDRLIDDLRHALGPDRVVWACKHVAGRLRFEFYLFALFAGIGTGMPDPSLRSSFESAVEVVRAIGTWTAPDTFTGEPVLVSFEVDIADDGSLTAHPTIDLSYNIGGLNDFVVNDELDHDGHRLKSVAHGFDVLRDRGALRARLASPRGATPGAAGDVARSWLDRIDATRECERCWVTSKRSSDGVYLSRTHIDDLVAFLDEFAYPRPLREWVDDHRHELDHLLFDLCFDHTVDDATVKVARTAFCGWF